MGAWFSALEPPSTKSGHVHPIISLTRIRILPESRYSPIIQDVWLPTHASASRDCLLAFITMLPMMTMLPDHELQKDTIRMVRSTGSAAGELSVISLRGSDPAFAMRMDKMWMTNERFIILVSAVLKGKVEGGPVDETIVGTTEGGRNFKDDEGKEKKEWQQQGAGIADPNDKTKEREKPENDKTDQEGSDEDRYYSEEDEDEDEENSEEEAEETVSQKQQRKERAKKSKYYQEKFDRRMSEPSTSQDSPQSQKHQHEPDLPPDEHGRRQPRSQVLRDHYAEERRERQSEAQGAGSVLSSEASKTSGLPTAPPSAPAPEPALALTSPLPSATDDTEVEQKAKLQKQLQNTITTSLSSRGKPTSSKSSSYKAPSGSDSPGKDLCHSTGSPVIPNDGEGTPGPLIYAEWVKWKACGKAAGGEGEGEEEEEEL